MEKIFDVLILGAGASGLMCAGELQHSSNLHVALIEGSDRPAQKLKISGGGKCNITNVNVTAEHFLGDELFIQSVLKQYGKEELLKFLHVNGIELELRKERYYFCKKSSNEIISLLLKRAKGTEFFYKHKVISANFENSVYSVTTQSKTFKTKKLVIATGGESFKNIGASDIGLKVASKFELSSTVFTPALVGLTVQKEQFWMKELSGVSCMVNIHVNSKTIEEELLFAHKGISGPAVLSASLYWKKGELCIDFLPHNNVDAIIESSKKLVSTAIPLSKRFMKLFLEHINVKDKPCNRLSSDEKKKLMRLKNYCFSPAGNFGFSKAEVSRGGVCTNDLHVESLMSKKQDELYFIGEVVDVTGELGGYNFQWAFSSAVVCAKAIVGKN
ncbi:MAG: aminoacetone oxidase family FAD-binding enzyme [Campylobacterota bacterium]|nr:aminoacetone oxidase family FAD-binding enzyme [Campylobacterota bacterium]